VLLSDIVLEFPSDLSVLSPSDGALVVTGDTDIVFVFDNISATDKAVGIAKVLAERSLRAGSRVGIQRVQPYRNFRGEYSTRTILDFSDDLNTILASLSTLRNSNQTSLFCSPSSSIEGSIFSALSAHRNGTSQTIALPMMFGFLRDGEPCNDDSNLTFGDIETLIPEIETQSTLNRAVDAGLIINMVKEPLLFSDRDSSPFSSGHLDPIEPTEDELNVIAISGGNYFDNMHAEVINKVIFTQTEQALTVAIGSETAATTELTASIGLFTQSNNTLVASDVVSGETFAHALIGELVIPLSSDFLNANVSITDDHEAFNTESFSIVPTIKQPKLLGFYINSDVVSVPGANLNRLVISGQYLSGLNDSLLDSSTFELYLI